MGFPSGSEVKNPLQCRRQGRCRFNPWVGKIPWRRKWLCTRRPRTAKNKYFLKTETFYIKKKKANNQ